ncbi:RDD family protein [Streptomyces sp. AK02-01A]|uniref:RDD family protein n=1 Tax=Streptomyces sp. AK02-01A TaxID=3028648 RepID=UPI0029B719A2|nr:RDD family protein [Streptomyces sp. AK02-01A]MDX3849111.1 RDD family protein [Streptomyces sp. AK02-01A]
MSNDQPPPGEPPEDDPFLKKPRQPPPSEGSGPAGSDGSPYGSSPGSPYGSPYGGGDGPPPGDGNAYGGNQYGGADPFAGMPPLAPFGKRFTARVADALIIFIPLAILSLLAGSWDSSANGGGGWIDFTDQVNTGTQWLWSLISVVAYVGYDTLMTKKYGQTVGKRWMRLRVAMLNNGAIPDTGASLLRAVVLWVPALVCCTVLWWIILIVSILVSRPYKQGLHDKAARTVVVSAAQ